MTLTEFLTARITDDEAAARRGSRHNAREVYANDNYGCLLVDPARVLAECEAKRATVQQAERWAEYIDATRESSFPREGDVLRSLLGPLASVYADHPDYDEAWRP